MGRKSNAQKALEAAQAAEAAAKQSKTEHVEESVEPSNQPSVEVVPRDDDRDNAMNEILSKRGQAEEPKAEEPKEELKEEPKEELKAEPEPEQVEQKPEMVRVKVDGEEFEVPKDEVEAAGSVAAYQREKAAENRLRRANETLAESRKVQAQIAQWMEQNTPKQVTETDDQFIAARMEAVRFGTEEEAALAMKEILNRTNKQVDPNMITTIAVNRIREDAGIEAFKKEFQDVVSNPLLLKLASTLEKERKQQLKQVPDWNEFYRSIGNEIRSVAGKPNQQPTKDGEGKTSQSEKEERKSSIVNLPTAASRAAMQEATKPETREDVLNEMREARGLLN